MYRRYKLITFATGSITVLLSFSAFPSVSAQDTCTAMQTASFPETTIVSATPIAAKAEPAVPAFCEIRVTISPVAASTIGAVYRLPEKWNGKVLGIGGGGAAGNLTLEAAREGLTRGYAVMQNDLGHPGTSPIDWSFALTAPGKANVDAIIDFGHRATHLATVVGKQVVAKFYGRSPQRAYFHGCSTGGRQGLAEVQRYPEDYDGVVAAAPVHTPLVPSSAVLRVQNFHGDPARSLKGDHVALIQKAVLAACDAKDGLADGILNDPRECTWDPGELACKGSDTAGCLPPAQEDSVRRMYAGVKRKDGTFAAMPMMRGGESEWLRRMIADGDAALGGGFFRYLVKHDPSYDLMRFDPEKDMSALRSGLVEEHVYQTNTDISRFLERPGKLLLWHGFNDPGPSALSTIEYYEAVRNKQAKTADGVRLFLAPGVGHCRGGPGADRFNALAVLETWVELGVPPSNILATNADSTLTRPLCPYPQLPRYDGRGNPNAAASFTCR